jgi:hypothetical protein
LVIAMKSVAIVIAATLSASNMAVSEGKLGVKTSFKIPIILPIFTRHLLVSLFIALYSQAHRAEQTRRRSLP